jgi:hypothetical protein
VSAGTHFCKRPLAEAMCGETRVLDIAVDIETLSQIACINECWHGLFLPFLSSPLSPFPMNSDRKSRSVVAASAASAIACSSDFAYIGRFASTSLCFCLSRRSANRPTGSPAGSLPDRVAELELLITRDIETRVRVRESRFFVFSSTTSPGSAFFFVCHISPCKFGRGFRRLFRQMPTNLT